MRQYRKALFTVVVALGSMMMMMPARWDAVGGQTVEPPASATPAERPALARPRAAPVFPLSFDGLDKEAVVPSGTTNAVLEFAVTNTSTGPVVVDQVRTSCGCSTVKLPSIPWRLEPGEVGRLRVVMDLRGKRGLLHKRAYVQIGDLTQALSLRARIKPPTGDLQGSRLKNVMLAAQDRQVVFQGDCARCHARPADGLLGRSLFDAACGVCHEAEHRAEMVPALETLRHYTRRAQWKHAIVYGKAGTLMPAFGRSQGGPLTTNQVESLAEYLTERYRGLSTPIPASSVQ